jgi:hypothetical protein
LTQPTGGGRRRIRGAIWTTVTVLVALGLIGWGGYTTWLAHSGTAANVYLKTCSHAGYHRRGVDLTWTCKGIWQHDNGTQQTLTVHNVPRGSTNTDMDVRVHGNDA